jgi:adenylate cyclase
LRPRRSGRTLLAMHALVYDTAEEEWAALLEGRHPHMDAKSPFRFVPSSPRCRFCKAPFSAPGAFVFRRFGMTPWPKNPTMCGRCFDGLATLARSCPHPAAGEQFGGAEIELSMLFADVRGSSKIARTMDATEFTRLMHRFYRTASDVLIDNDAIIEKFVGDEVVGLFIPMMTGPGHAGRALAAARSLLEETGHGSGDGPWVPVGAAVHTGRAFVGVVGSTDMTADFTALGDAMNLTAHLASQAATGEILVTDAAASGGELPTDGLERRHLSLKGHPAEATVVTLAAAP